MCGGVYARRQAGLGVVRGVLLAHLLVLWNYVLFLACWKAVVRMIRGQRGWAKTARVAEAVA